MYDEETTTPEEMDQTTEGTEVPEGSEEVVEGVEDEGTTPAEGEVAEDMTDEEGEEE